MSVIVPSSADFSTSHAKEHEDETDDGKQNAQ